MRKKMRYFDDLHAELAEVNFKINDPKTGLESLHCDYHYLAKTTKKYNKKANDELFDFEMERSKMRDVMDRTKRYKDDCDEVLKKNKKKRKNKYKQDVLWFTNSINEINEKIKKIF